MADAPLLQLSGIALTHGGAPLLRDVSLAVRPGERIALVGRNGSGKSTLMRIMAGRVEADAGVRSAAAGARIGLMEQDPDMSGFASLGDFAAAGLAAGQAHRVEIAAQGLKFDPSQAPDAASGGERRRAALARILAEDPDLMLLDEPTNHIDVEAIAWLEGRLRGLRGGCVIVSHDRALLAAATGATLWVDRGEVRRLDRGFAHFEDWRDEVWAKEDRENRRLDRRVAAESRWAAEGISGRRRRNQGRLRELRAMKAAQTARIGRAGTAAMALESGPRSGRKAVEARGLRKRLGGREMAGGFDFRIMRGDRIAIVGPNGAGKTTLLRLLMKEIAPDEGSVKHGSGLAPAVFDQSREALDPALSLWENLTGDAGLRVRGRSDQIMVRGAPRHVVGYLKDFLFDERRARAPAGSLSGGEQARLLLARIMARESNFLALDEPTNDLDVESLDLLQELLGDYDGTVILVSHDRDFVDRVAARTVFMDGAGDLSVHVGGWSDALAQRAAGDAAPLAAPAGAAKPAASAKRSARAGGGAKPKRAGLTFTQRHRLGQMPQIAGRLEGRIGELEEVLSDPGLYARDEGRFREASQELARLRGELGAIETEWMELMERDEG